MKLSTILFTALALTACGKSAPKLSPTITHSDQDVIKAYNEIMMLDKDKQVAAFTEKLGDPNSANGDTLVWYGKKGKDQWGPAACYELQASPDKSSMAEVDVARCGLTK